MEGGSDNTQEEPVLGRWENYTKSGLQELVRDCCIRLAHAYPTTKTSEATAAKKTTMNLFYVMDSSLNSPGAEFENKLFKQLENLCIITHS